MFFVLTLVVVWTLKVSQSLKAESPLKRAKHGRRRVSYFRRGLTAIRSCIHNVVYCLGELMYYVHLLTTGICMEVLDNEVPKHKAQLIQARLAWELA